MDIIGSLAGHLIITSAIALLLLAVIYIVIVKWVYEPFIAAVSNHPWKFFLLLGLGVIIFFIGEWALSFWFLAILGIGFTIFGYFMEEEEKPFKLINGEIVPEEGTKIVPIDKYRAYIETEQKPLNKKGPFKTS